MITMHTEQCFDRGRLLDQAAGPCRMRLDRGSLVDISSELW